MLNVVSKFMPDIGEKEIELTSKAIKTIKDHERMTWQSVTLSGTCLN